jgi:hypothetical protein
MEVKAVENLWMIGEFPVHESTAEFFFAAPFREIVPMGAVYALSRSASRDRRGPKRRMSAPKTTQLFATPVTSAVHRFEESIAGRPYLIEVAAVSKDRWRAYIVRIPGIPTALMPFYGSTPVEAARLLCDWLTRAHARASAPAGPAGSV